MSTKTWYRLLLSYVTVLAVLACMPPINFEPTPQNDCPFGKTLCAGSCKNLTSDSSNCNGCGNVCPAAHSCINSVCTKEPPSCPAGQTMCNNTCTNTNTDPANCGGCGGTPCTAMQACVNGVCSAASCPAGETMCSGACKTTNTDPTLCGDCGNQCGAAQVCTNGVCT
jgi:hypothetical protein